MFDKVRNFFAATKPASGGAGALPPAPLPKPTTKQMSLAGYAKTVKPTAAALTKNDLQLTNQDLATTYRQGATTLKVIQDLTRVSPDLSAAVSAFLRVGIPENYMAVATNPDGSFNREATALAMQILARMDFLPDYLTGFSQTGTIRSLAESMGKELIQSGACMMELVLDKGRMPSKFSPIPTASIEWYQDGTGLKPKQVVSGTRLDLDFPTVIYTSIDQPLTSAYPESPIESAVQPVLASMTFLNDLRRVCARHVYPRYDVSLDEDKLRTRIPPTIAADPDKLAEFLNEILAEVEDVINNLGVEDALSHFDFMSIKYIEGATDVPQTFETVKDIYNSKVATGARAMPSILGHSSASQNIASTETMLFLLSANGMIRLKLQEVLSKGMTLAVRLFGMDVTVKFQFDSIELRPESELEAFKVMKQSRILELLSLGFITDDQASMLLCRQLTPAGYTPKTGTMFHTAKATVDNPNSNTGAVEQSLSSKAPKQAKGPAK